MILKQKNNLKRNLILIKEHFQDKVDLVKSDHVKVISIKKIMQSKWFKIDKALLILQKLKSFNKLKRIMIIVQLNIMTSDIDMNNNSFKYMNILQLKWILYNLIQKSNY